ncbi:MAG: multidrug transporter, partial [Nevskia sp.]|nr:multidrug transporter [Nevskia sp.]
MTTRRMCISSTGTPAKFQDQASQPAYSVLAIAGLTVALCACVPDLGPMTRTKSADVYISGKSLAAPEGVWPESEWWHAYGDPQLDRLIAEALDGSPDLRIAEARFRQAEAAAGQAGAALWPEISAQGSATAIHQSLHQGFPDSFQSFLPHGWRSQGTLTANLDYEIDLFGKNRAALAAATSAGEAAQIDAVAARLALSVAVAEAYADLVQLDADRRADEDALRVRSDSAKLVNDRAQQQLENSGEVSQARSRVATARADLDVVHGQLALTRNRISALVGQGPDRGLDIVVADLPNLHAFGVPKNLAADLLGRRVDIVAARLRVEAAAKRIDVARADFYPNVDLT